jgi:RNA polymerase sigma-70 factor (family 1)
LPGKIRHIEQDLLQRVAQGSHDAFSSIFEKYWDTVYSASFVLTKSPELSKDIAQEVFIRLWLRRADAPSIDHVENYLFIIARNLIYERFRKEAVHEKYKQFIKDHFHEKCWSPDVITESRELDQAMMNTIRQFPPQQQKAFRLCRFNAMSYDEVGHEMGITKNTVKAYIAASLSALRKVSQQHSSKLLLAVYFFF